MQRVFLAVLLLFLAYIFVVSENMLKLSAGIAIFIFGMVVMGDGFKSFSGGALEKFLRRYTSNTPKSIIFGIFSTAIMQSSTLISLVTISFLSAGLLDLIQGIGIIFGSQIGTTSGAWLIGGLGVKVDIGKYASPIIIFGVIFLLQNSKKFKSLGYVLIGIGFLFLGVDYIKTGFEEIGKNVDLTQYSIDGMKGVLVFFVVGTLIAIVTQSSLATIVLTIAALSAEQISYPNALGIIIGANLGTTLTALISSLGSNAEGKRLALIYLLFNIFICTLSIIFLRQLIFLVDFEAGVLGIGENNMALKLAIFHTTINVMGVAMLYPLIGKIAKLSTKIIKQKSGKNIGDDVLYLNNASIGNEDALAEVLYKEICHLYQNAVEIMALGIYIKTTDIKSSFSADEIILLRKNSFVLDFEELYQKRIKTIYGKIINFIIVAQSQVESEAAIKHLTDLQKAAQNIVEALKNVKHLQKNMIKYVGGLNDDIRQAYNEIREVLIAELKILDKIFALEGDANELVAELTKISERFDKNANRSLGALIKTGKISPLIGTSLMNDISYAFHISKNLAEAATLIFIDGIVIEEDQNKR